MPALIDLTDRTFGLLTVRKRLGNRHTPSGARQPVWGCVCACGRRTIEEGRALRAGRALSCRSCVRDPSRTLKYGRVYLIYFPEHQVLKIGFHTSSHRLRELLDAGGIHVDEYRDVDKSWEDAGRDALTRMFPHAFTNRSDAARVIPRGAGWTDCYTVNPEDLLLARDEILEAGLKKGNDFGQNPPATVPWLRALARIQSARRRARAGRADAAGSSSADRDSAADPAGRGVDSEAAARGDASRLGDRPHRARRARAGRRRVRRHVGARRPRMARPAPIWAQRPARCPGVSNSLLDRAVDGAHFHRLRREGKRGGEHERARASKSTCRRGEPGLGCTSGTGVLETATTQAAQASPDLECSTARLQGSPRRSHRRRMRTLRYGGRYPQDLVGQREVHGGTGAVRGSAGAGVGGLGR